MITLESLTKIFETAEGTTVAADHINMEVPQGEICILLGPSGCGKTTTLKMVNRIIPATSGKVYIDGKDTTHYKTVELRRNIGYVIQQIGLFPNMTVEENIAVVPKLLGWDRERIRKRAAKMIEMMALDPGIFLKRYPRELSGGQAQRIGVARALAADPPVMLMDEPFGAIDPINREIIQDEFLKMQAQLKKTILFVSHDIDEAVKMGDKVAIFRAGKLEQYDSPDNILAHPTNSFVADFVGSDRTLKRLRLVKVRDGMLADPPRVRAEDSLEKALGLMDEYGHNSVVMVGPRGRARGVVYRNVAREKRGLCGEHRSGLKATVRINEDLRTAVSLMFTHDTTWLPCVDDDGFYKGYISQAGITHLLGETYRDATQQVPAVEATP
ncbi:MAG: ABC transporter ATP-binding protein [Candidatus Competibacteraceae bacterium]|nr:ABC transporter ATP-binding protein [Candidatus Competibacteraceae bacterium]